MKLSIVGLLLLVGPFAFASSGQDLAKEKLEMYKQRCSGYNEGNKANSSFVLCRDYKLYEGKLVPEDPAHKSEAAIENHPGNEHCCLVDGTQTNNSTFSVNPNQSKGSNTTTEKEHGVK